MTILKPGVTKSWSKKTTCTGVGNGRGGCGAKLLVEKADLFQTYRSYMGREEEWLTTFECPQCHVRTDLDTPFAALALPNYSAWLLSRE